MTDREAVHLLNRTNRRHALLTTSPIKTEEQVQTWNQELRAGLIALSGAGYNLFYATDYPRPRYVFEEPAENLGV